METIITTLLFIFPGACVELLYKRVLPCKREEESSYEKTAKTLVYSIFVLLINLLAIKFIFKGIEINLDSFETSFINTKFLVQYTLLTLVSSGIFAIAWHYFNKYIVLIVINMFRKFIGLSPETSSPTVWDKVFENPKINMSGRVISIHKDGEIISQGLLGGYGAPTSKEKEFQLISPNWIKRILREDEALPEDERYLDNVDMEYYDCATGTLIKIYDSEKVLRHPDWTQDTN